MARILRHRSRQGPLGTRPPTGHDETVVHLRRGDYVRAGWALNSKYYRMALKEFERRSPGMDRNVTIIADDRMAAEGLATVLRLDGWSASIPSPEPEVGGPELAVEEFRRIADASRLVMSNSTFCWWAAVVGDAIRPGRTVVFPSDWIGTGGDQLWRPGWIRVPSTTDGRQSRAGP